jgi:hypothetical protein
VLPGLAPGPLVKEVLDFQLEWQLTDPAVYAALAQGVDGRPAQGAGRAHVEKLCAAALRAQFSALALAK